MSSAAQLSVLILPAIFLGMASLFAIRQTLKYLRMRHRALEAQGSALDKFYDCLLYTSPSPRDQRGSRMPSSA